MIRRIGYPLALLAFFFIAGAHGAAIRSIAWVERVVAHAHHTTLRHAVADAFDSGHLCLLCKKLAAAKKSAPPATQLRLLKHLKCLLVAKAPLPAPAASLPPAFAAGSPFLPLRHDAPPTPPPRLFAA